MAGGVEEIVAQAGREEFEHLVFEELGGKRDDLEDVIHRFEGADGVGDFGFNLDRVLENPGEGLVVFDDPLLALEVPLRIEVAQARLEFQRLGDIKNR